MARSCSCGDRRFPYLDRGTASLVRSWVRSGVAALDLARANWIEVHCALEA